MCWIDSSEFAGFCSYWLKSTVTHECFGSVYCYSHKEIDMICCVYVVGRFFFKHHTVYIYAFILLMKQFRRGF